MTTVHVEIDFIIAHIFALGAKEVSIKSLNELIDSIMSKQRDVYIQLTTNALISISESEPNMFNYTDSAMGYVVQRGYWDNPRVYFDNLIKNIGLPKEQLGILQNGILAQFDDKALNEVFGIIFTPWYIEKHFDYKVPEQYREPIIKIIHDYCQEHNLIPQIP